MKIPHQDKTLHFAAGTLAAAVGVLAAALRLKLGMHTIAPWAAGLALCLFVALLREAYNWRTGGRFDWRDVAATMGGGACVAASAWGAA